MSILTIFVVILDKYFKSILLGKPERLEDVAKDENEEKLIEKDDEDTMLLSIDKEEEGKAEDELEGESDEKKVELKEEENEQEIEQDQTKNKEQNNDYEVIQGLNIYLSLNVFPAELLPPD